MTKLETLVREWQEARKPAALPAPGEGLVETYQACVRRMVAADEALAAYDLKRPAGGAIVGQTAPAESTGILIGDVVLVGGHREPPQFQAVTTNYECEHWQARREEIVSVFRPVWRNAFVTGVSYIIPDGPYLCACTCGCVDRTIRRGRCMVCRVRESCLKKRICEACEDGYRLASDGIHYDHNDSTWGVCRKVIASIRMDRGEQS